MRTYWLSFCDIGLPHGQQFLGVVIIDVTDADEGSWIRSALRLAWESGVNPGGEVMSVRIDASPEFANYPRLQLLSREDIEQLEP